MRKASPQAFAERFSNPPPCISSVKQTHIGKTGVQRAPSPLAVFFWYFSVTVDRKVQKRNSPLNCNLLFTSQMYLLLFYHKSHEKASADLKNGQETGARKQKYLPKIRLQNRAYFTKIRRHTNYLQSRAGNPLTTCPECCIICTLITVICGGIHS